MSRRLPPEQRRGAILVAARQEFAAAPYAEVSMLQVARRAGVSEALVHKYFPGKAGLHAQVVQQVLDELWTSQQQAMASLPTNTATRERVRAALELQLDRVQALRHDWTSALLGSPGEPPESREVREAARTRQSDGLARLLGSDDLRRRYAVHGWFGFVDEACRAWAGQGCPDEQRPSLVTACLGCLEGALGDWG